MVHPDIFAGENPTVSPPNDCPYCGVCYQITISIIATAHLWEQRQGTELHSCFLVIESEVTGTAQQ